MEFRKIQSIEPVVAYLSDTLKTHLDKGESVLWLVPGGSAIEIAMQVSQQLQGVDASNLHVTLTDERYGTIGHSDSNWRQLEDAGFHLTGAHMLPVVRGRDREETTQTWAQELGSLLQSTDYKLGFFGIGPDGHTSGILPGSPAVDAPGLVAAYDANFERITTTPKAIAQLDEAVVYAVGEAKWPVLDELDADLPLDTQPAQVLKQIPKTTIFNDYKGEEV